MAQIQKGDTFVDGQQVTGARLNQLVDSAVILPQIITDQVNLAANTVATGDSVLIYDLSATALREATASDLLNSNLPVTTSSVTAGANSDIVVTPNDGTLVTGATYTSTDGLTVVVSSTGHSITQYTFVTISSAGTGYNGTFIVTAVATNTFTYVMTTAATPTTGTPSCAYTKKGTEKVVGNESVSSNLYVNGGTAVGGNLVVAGSTIHAGTTTNTGAVTNTGSVTSNGAVTMTGDVNITGTISYNGTPVFGLYAIDQQTITWTAGTGLKWTSPVFTKPSDEIWEFEVFGNFQVAINNGGTSYFDFRKNDGTTIYFTVVISNYESGGAAKWYVNSGTALTNETVKLYLSGVQQNTNPLYLSIKKYKTA